MFLERIRIANFKSLKDVEVRPSGLTTLVGPNNAGKTNFALAMKFLADIPRRGLESAIGEAGGLHSIVRRKTQRSRRPIAFELDVSFSPRGEQPELAGALAGLSDVVGGAVTRVAMGYGFSLRASGNGLHGEFAVAEENLRVSVQTDRHLQRGTELVLYDVSRDAKGALHIEIPKRNAYTRRLRSYVDSFAALACRAQRGRETLRMSPQEILLGLPLGSDPFLYALSAAVRGISAFRFSPSSARHPGPPTPNPVLGWEGDALAALIEWLPQRNKKRWSEVLGSMRDIVPGLKDIVVERLPSGALGVSFVEEGFSRPWHVNEVSDGTIQVLCMLLAVTDPQAWALVIEEPENSLHPWMVRQIGQRFRKLAEEKTVILTTQSPVVIDMLFPEEVWIVSRKKGQTSIRRLTDLDQRIGSDWREGKIGLSEYLDMGLMPCAVPGGGDG